MPLVKPTAGQTHWDVTLNTALDYLDGKIVPDYVTTNHYYVDGSRTDTYTATGSQNYPFKTIVAAQTAINTAITAGDLTPAMESPVFIILMNSITENVTLSVGHIYLVSDLGTVHTPVYLNGSVTVNGANSSGSALDVNHFAISGITIVADPQDACIYFTGSHPQQLFLSDIWLQASGNQTGSTVFTNTGGYGLYADNTGTGSIINGRTFKMSHTGTGDVYCVDIVHGEVTLYNVETDGSNAQFMAVRDGAIVELSECTLAVSGEACAEVYAGGHLGMRNCLVSNTNSGLSYGINLKGTGAHTMLRNVNFEIQNTSNSGSRAIKGVSGSIALYQNIIFSKKDDNTTDTNTKIDTAITRTALTNTFNAV